MMPNLNRYSPTTIRAKIKPFRLIWLPTVGSTNTWAARARRKKKLFAPSVVLTGRQTLGRGRGANTFTSPGGVMTATFVLPINETIAPNLVPLLAGLAARDAIHRVAGIDVGLKWPNDLWHDDLKLAGLLCERIDGVDLIGIGINLNLDPSDMPKNL
ncbi:MAG TPA: biotin--[acetyl-CoA-carboxylase] ligase, partial [Tepidisphaeraceae bacterium]|nr:biotin--[acetyl-CoA-carboxylase] ligase [Tepidisphaeraceae bacterium]